MAKNMLKLNDDKTECILVGKSKQRGKIPNLSVKIGDHDTQPSNSVRNLGIEFDSDLDMERQVSKICKSAHFQLRMIGSMRKYLSNEVAETLVHAFIASRLDYGN